ncbi:MAG: ribose-phosphate pyrophosphokinase [Neomegalonema sp.]|nr:ribose-phosphate pyrophosphokinase [Neomegalonema sp.]
MPVKSESSVRLVCGNANKPLAEAIARRVSYYRGEKVELASARVERFKDDEIYVEIYDNVRGEDVFVIQPTSKPANDNLMELLVIIDALRRSSAMRITAVMPYFGYARQDRRTAARTPISAKLVANLLTEAGADRILTLDLHAGQIQGFFDIPTDNLYAAPVFALDIKHHFRSAEDLMIVSPDVGGVVRARDLAKRIDAALSIVDKRRVKANEVSEMTVIGDVKDRTCILVDDICDTAGTLQKAAEKLMEDGARAVHAYVTHGVLSNPAIERISNSVLESVVITDSITPRDDVLACDKIRILPLAPLLAQAILNVGNDTSVSSLFSEDDVAPLYEGYYGAV